MQVSSMKVTATTQHKLKSHHLRGVVLLVIGVISLIASMLMSITLGATTITFSTVWDVLFHLNMENTNHQIIYEIRIPRVIGAALVGMSFAVAGALMQGLTRNPLADSSILGVNAGATFMLAICFAILPQLSYTYVVLMSFLGAAIGALLVFGLGFMSKQRLSPLRIILCGAAVSALLTALGEGIALYFSVGQDIAFWFAGGVSGTTWAHLKIITPFIVIAVLSALLLAKSVTILSFGEEIAIGLGKNTLRIKIIVLLIVLILAGGAVSVVGAVGFVGLIVPHFIRYIVGTDYRWIVAGSIVYGALLVVLADCAARNIRPPYEMPIGALIALIGVPFFLYIARKQGRNL
jgi:iron complex transport system permease protein